MRATSAILTAVALFATTACGPASNERAADDDAPCAQFTFEEASAFTTQIDEKPTESDSVVCVYGESEPADGERDQVRLSRMPVRYWREMNRTNLNGVGAVDVRNALRESASTESEYGSGVEVRQGVSVALWWRVGEYGYRLEVDRGDAVVVEPDMVDFARSREGHW